MGDSVVYFPGVYLPLGAGVRHRALSWHVLSIDSLTIYIPGHSRLISEFRRVPQGIVGLLNVCILGRILSVVGKDHPLCQAGILPRTRREIRINFVSHQAG